MKVALITGGSRGLGKNAALKLAKKGVGVILTFHSQEGEALGVVAEIEKAGGKALALKLDTGRVSTFEAFTTDVASGLTQKFKTDRFDYLLNNAGMGISAPIAEMTEEQFDQLMNVHFKGVFFLTQKLLPLMRDGGRILNVSSGLARFSLVGFAAYGAMKGAIEVFTRYLAQELGPRRIAVNTIAPGAIATDFGGGKVRDNKQFQDHLSSQTALGRVGEADDIGDAMAELLAGNLNWVNVQRIEASGGYLL